MAVSKSIIEAKNLVKTFRRHSNECTALSGFSLTIHQGESVAILGESGSGKSTFIRCLLGLEKLSSGELWVDGIPLHEKNAQALSLLRKKMAWIAQDYHLLGSYTVFENVALPLRLAGKSDTYISQKCHFLLEKVGLSEKKDVYPSQLSGGQQQRVAIARALSRDPEILLCDEPTSALDPFTTRSIIELLKKLKSELQLTIVLVTHHEEVARHLCERMVVMNQGKSLREEIFVVREFKKEVLGGS